MLKNLPEDSQQLRPKHVETLTNTYFVLELIVKGVYDYDRVPL